jgi:methionine-rich copper-binding protein CopC
MGKEGMNRLLLIVIFSLWVTSATAHSILDSTTPANEAVVATAPSDILLAFKKVFDWCG